MITLITGLPGHGKTLYTLTMLKAMAEKEKREVFYSGVKDLMLPWTEFKAEEWPSLPDGSMILIDEAQFVFPKKPNGSALPDFYKLLATHRHSGKDIFLITQDGALVDNFVRKLVDRHLHVVRKFGMERATIYEFQGAQTAPTSAGARSAAVTSKWSYPKSSYGFYKSAELHTVKRRIPVKVVLAMVFVVGMIFLGWFSLKRFQARAHKDEVSSSASAPVGPAGPAGVPPGGYSAAGEKPFDPVADAKRYVAMNTPRVVGLPHTAPKYDEQTKPTRVPVPAMCIEFKGTCQCKTQQATPMDVPDGMCRSFARNGFFEDFDPEKDRKDSTRTAQAARVMDGHDVVPPASAVQRQASFEVKEEQGGVVAFTTQPDLPRTPTAGGHSKPAQLPASPVPST
jgi:zona occludens toxin